MSKGGSDTSTQTVQTADPWSGQQPYLTDVFQQAQAQYNQPGPYYYPGDTVAPFTGAEQTAQQNIADYADLGARYLANQGLETQGFMLGDVLRADSNPYMQDYAAAAIAPAWDALLRQGLPNVQSGAVANGQYGGSRQGVAEGIALGDAMRGSLDTTAKMYGSMYGQNLDAMQKALALQPQMLQTGAMPDTMLAGVGQQQREMSQAMMDDAVARWEFEQGLPSSKLAQYSSAIQGSYGGSSTSETSGETGGAGTAGRVAGGVMSGLGTYGMMSNAGLWGGAGSAGAIAMGTAAPFVAGAMAIANLFIK